MRCLKLCAVFGFALSLSLAGCGPDTGAAKPVTNMSEIDQYLAENPDQNVDGLEDETQDVDLAE